jgi:hypothetical protein
MQFLGCFLVAKKPLESPTYVCYYFCLALTFAHPPTYLITMKIVRVHYTTTAEFAPRNKENIAGIVSELKTLNHPGIKYSTYVLPNGKTFMHLDHFESEEAHQVLTGLESFKKFDAELWASRLETEPKLELLSLVAATTDFFD